MATKVSQKADQLARRTYNGALKLANKPGMSDEKVSQLLSKAHELGSPDATYALATWYLHGKFFPKNISRGTKLLKLAAEKNIVAAQFDLAISYLKGIGTVINSRKAVELLLKSALSGDEAACYELYRCYWHGIGVKRDRRTANIWADHSEKLRKQASKAKKTKKMKTGTGYQ